jgi:MYXO-CTERM domain-containing protein
MTSRTLPKLGLLVSLAASFVTSAPAKALTVTEPPDHSNTLPGTTHVIEAGTNTISGRLQTPSDGQDNFRVTVPADHRLETVTLSLNTGGGFSGFVTWNTSETRMSSGSFTTGLPAGPGTYQLQVVANFAVGNNWSLTFTVVRTCSSSTQCADGVECTQDICSGGVCSNPPRSAGAPCGSSADTACTAPDTCNGAGSCLPNHAVAGAACGDQGVACTVDDACDGSGSCVDNGFEAVGAACGDATDDACTDPDSCDGSGACLPNHAGAGAACGDQGVACTVDDACDGSGSCVDNGFEAAGTACGDATDDVCTDPDSCDGSGACLTNHAALGTSCEAGTFCTSGDGCMEGACVEGSAMTCAADEKCDEDGDMCFAACGDGVMDEGEGCDDGDANSDTEADACRSDCTLPSCGDGVTDDGEACDDGGPTGECTSECELVEVDAGVPEDDAGLPAGDAAISADAGTGSADGGTEPDSDDGCSCRVAATGPRSSRAPWLFAGLALVAFVRRRRR